MKKELIIILYTFISYLYLSYSLGISRECASGISAKKNHIHHLHIIRKIMHFLLGGWGGGGVGASRVHYGGCANGELDCLRHVRRDFLSAER